MGRSFCIPIVGLLLGHSAFAVPAARSDANTVPLQLSLWSPVQLVRPEYEVYGLRLSLLYGANAALQGIDLGLAGRVEGDWRGVGVGGVLVADEDAEGIRVSLINMTGRKARTVDVALWNHSASVAGAQVALVNRAGRLKGLQLGVLNFAGDVTGAQIGLINFGRGAGPFRVMPLLNIGTSKPERKAVGR